MVRVIGQARQIPRGDCRSRRRYTHSRRAEVTGDIELIRGDVGKLDGKIDKLNESVANFMQQQVGKVATLEAHSETANRNIGELWQQFNLVKSKQTELHAGIERVEARARGMAKMWALIGGAAALIVALMEIFERE
tara:strand:+ start:432 stop:839 length:408 start_codon:yes stop_codon:yes gene_type:complete